MTRVLKEGEILTSWIKREPGKKPMVIIEKYFIYIQPKEDVNYMAVYNSIREGELARVVIGKIFHRNGLPNCDAYLTIADEGNCDNSELERKSTDSDENAEKDNHFSEKYKRMNERMEKYFSFENELQSRFGNETPSEEVLEGLRKKWRMEGFILEN